MSKTQDLGPDLRLQIVPELCGFYSPHCALQLFRLDNRLTQWPVEGTEEETPMAGCHGALLG